MDQEMERKEREPRVTDVRQKPLRGIRIRAFNFWIIVCACILYVALIHETISVAGEYKHLQAVSELYISCERDAALVREGSDYLTEQVRMYAVTGEGEYMDLYFYEADVAQRRDLALAELAQNNVSSDLSEELAEALKSSNNLMEREIYAMKLVAVATQADPNTVPGRVQTTKLTDAELALTPQEQMEKGRALVFDEEYQLTKQDIMGHVADFSAGVLDYNQQRRAQTAQELSRLLYRQRLLISALFVLTALTFIFITVLIVKPLSIYVKCIKDDKLFEVVGAYEFKYLAVTYNDIYELNAANEAMLHQQAETDALTGLVNRGAFDRHVAVLKTSQRPVALLLVDVDQFKDVNDQHGHAVGDKLLQKVAGLLSQSFRSTDMTARIGGDEFGVVIMDATFSQREVIRRKIDAVNEILQAPDDGLPAISISVGGAFSVVGYTDELYQQADEALYRVKKEGRRGCAFYTLRRKG